MSIPDRRLLVRLVRPNVRCAVLTAAVAAVWASSASVHASFYTYTNLASAAETWSSGANWTPTAPPGAPGVPADPDTILNFGGTGAEGTLAAGVAITSDNNIAGNFPLNQLNANYTGPTSGTAPAVTITGNPLQFVRDTADNAPALTITSNRAGSGTASRPVVTVANDLIVGSDLFTISASSNIAGGANSGNVFINGGLSFSTAGPHTIAFGGTGATGSNLSGRSIFADAIADASGGGPTNVTKSGTSFWELSGANDYTGGTTVEGGMLRIKAVGGLGTGDVAVSGGGTVWLDNAGTYSQDFSISGNGQNTKITSVGADAGAIQFGPGSAVTGTITLQGDSRVTATNNSSTGGPVATISGQITGAFGITYGNGSGVKQGPLVIANADTENANNYTGDTVFSGENRSTGGANSGGEQTFILGAAEQIPHGAEAGNVIMSIGDGSGQTLDLNGFSETINGLNSEAYGRSNRRIIRNNAAGTNATLTLGANDANGTFLGTIMDGVGGANASTVSLTKVGTGTQTLTGVATYTGPTTISGGTLEIDYNQHATAGTETPANYFATGSDLVLDGGATFAINGRGNGTAQTTEGSASNKFGFPGSQVVTGLGDTSGLVVGQFIDGPAAVNVQEGTYIVRIESSDAISISKTPITPFPNNTTVALTIDAVESQGVASQEINSLTLAGDAGSISTLDFGTTGGVILTFGSVEQTNEGALLEIANWSGDDVNGGGLDQLLFLGEPEDFSSEFLPAEVSFGALPGYALLDRDGFYEVIPSAVPEPTSLALVALAGAGLLSRRRRPSAAD